MVRNLLLVMLLLLAMLIAVVFAAANPGVVEMDLAFASFELQKSLAFILLFAAGWLCGLACCGLFMLKTVYERRRLGRRLGLAEAEVKSLRTLPLQDAD
ncbi:MAG: hypothetical protein ACR2P6_00430 [Gammaproteobacteria bacterium]